MRFKPWYCALFILLLGIGNAAFPGPTAHKKSVEKMMAKVKLYRQNNEHAIIKEFFQLLSIPNVAKDRENIRKNAEFIKTIMEKRGIKTKILESDGNPFVYGELNVKNAKRTLLFYIHYDGQPVDPSKWTGSHPFKPVIRPYKMKAGTAEPKPIPLPSPGKKFDPEWRIYARSASDDKAPIVSILTALDALKHEKIPLRHNIKFILDGEEEAGSPSMRAFLVKEKNRLKADVLFMCDGPGYFSGAPTLFYGVRGITSFEVTVYGPNVSLHSGHYGNWAPNPGMRLAQLLATMKAPDGRVLVKGFYDTVVALSPREKKALDSIPPYDNELMKLYGFARSEDPKKSLLHSLLLPSLNVNGMRSGYVGSQARTIVPSTAVASFDIRMVKNNDPKDMVNKVVRHIKAQGFHVVTAEPDNATRSKYPLLVKVVSSEKGYRASRTSMDIPVSVGVINALSAHSDVKPVLIPTLGGSLPIYIFEDILGIPTIGLPVVNYDNNQHQPDENLRIGHLWQAIETFSAILMME